MSALIPQNICAKPLQLFALVHNLPYAKKRPANALATHDGPNINCLLGASQCL